MDHVSRLVMRCSAGVVSSNPNYHEGRCKAPPSDISCRPICNPHCNACTRRIRRSPCFSSGRRCGTNRAMACSICSWKDGNMLTSSHINDRCDKKQRRHSDILMKETMICIHKHSDAAVEMVHGLCQGCTRRTRTSCQRQCCRNGPRDSVTPCTFTCKTDRVHLCDAQTITTPGD